MNTVTHRFCDPDNLIDRVHSVFEDWREHDLLPHGVDEDLVHRLKLAVHEWLANLVQHAEFKDRCPEISITLRGVPRGIECVIDDNSEGFDLDGHLSAKPEVIDAFPERGMGLLMIKACAEELSYEELDSSLHRLQFTVSPDRDPWLNIPF